MNGAALGSPDSLYQRLLKPCLFLLPAEVAHELATWLLAVLGRVRPLLRWVRSQYGVADAGAAVETMGLTFTTPDYRNGRPSGLGVDNRGHLIVCDSHYHCVRIYDAEAKEEKCLTGDFGYVSDCVQDAEGFYYVSEFGVRDRITKLDSDGNVVARWGEAGSEPGQLLRTRALAFGPDGNLYAVDACNHRIQVFTRDGNREGYMRQSPGLNMACAEWLHRREVAAIACDNNAVEVIPFEDQTLPLPLHQLCLRDMGLTLGEMFDFEALAADCAADGVWECLFTAPPLKVTGAVGSPLNPLAVK